MKHILVAILITIITFITGCDDNNIVDPNKNTKVYFEIDSLGIETSNSGWIYLTNTFTNIPLFYKTKVEFTGHTNLDSTCQMSLYTSASDSGSNYFNYNLNTFEAINQFHSFEVSYSGKNPIINFIAQIIYLNPEIVQFNGNGYIYFKNIKVALDLN